MLEGELQPKLNIAGPAAVIYRVGSESPLKVIYQCRDIGQEHMFGNPITRGLQVRLLAKESDLVERTMRTGASFC